MTEPIPFPIRGEPISPPPTCSCGFDPVAFREVQLALGFLSGEFQKMVRNQQKLVDALGVIENTHNTLVEGYERHEQALKTIRKRSKRAGVSLDPIDDEENLVRTEGGIIVAAR